jgi:hypothetical protein
LKKAFDTGGPGLHKLRLEVEKYEAMGTVVMNSAHRGDIRTEVSKSIRAEVAESVKTSRRPRAAVSLLLIVSAKSLSLETHTQFFKGVIMTRLLNSSRASSALKVPRASRRQLAIQYRPIGDLRLDPKNPRLHSSKQIAQIAASVSRVRIPRPSAGRRQTQRHRRPRPCGRRPDTRFEVTAND